MVHCCKGLRKVQTWGRQDPFVSAMLDNAQLQHTDYVWGGGTEPCWDRPVQDGGAGIAVGSSHACGILVDGTARCWGDNSYGMLGQNDREKRGHTATAPYNMASLQPIDFGGAAVVSVSMGPYTVCALLATVQLDGPYRYKNTSCQQLVTNP